MRVSKSQRRRVGRTFSDEFERMARVHGICHTGRYRHISVAAESGPFLLL